VLLLLLLPLQNLAAANREVRSVCYQEHQQLPSHRHMRCCLQQLSG
jgi:hypothetical protein